MTDLENNVDALDIWKVELPSNIVEGSARGWITVAGDLLGPSIDVSIPRFVEWSLNAVVLK